MSEEGNVSFIEHLSELRLRLVKCAIAIAICFVVAWIFRGDLLFILKKPLMDALPGDMHNIVLLRIVDKFFIHLKISLMGGIFLSSPVLFFQLWRFVAPGLYKSEKRYVLPFVVFSVFFFSAGVAFCYFLILPFGFDFLVKYSIDSGQVLFGEALSDAAVPAAAVGDLLQISLREHISFTGTLLLVFGVAFETPLFIFLLSSTGLVSAAWFAKQRKYAVVIAFFMAAILTPPDPWTQSALALPLILLYEIGIWSTRLLLIWKKDKTDEIDDDDENENGNAESEGEPHEDRSDDSPSSGKQ